MHDILLYLIQQQLVYSQGQHRMAYFYITAAAAVNLQKDRVRKVLITVNASVTGTITISDETGTTGTPVVGIITNPTVGTNYEYWDFKTGVTITPSAISNLTVNVDSSYGAH